MDKQNALTVVQKPTGSKQAIIDGIKTLLVEVNLATTKASETQDTVKRRDTLKDLSQLHESLVEVFAIVASLQIDK